MSAIVQACKKPVPHSTQHGEHINEQLISVGCQCSIFRVSCFHPGPFRYFSFKISNICPAYGFWQLAPICYTRETLTNFSIFAVGQYLFLACSEGESGSKFVKAYWKQNTQSACFLYFIINWAPKWVFLLNPDRHFMWLSLILFPNCHAGKSLSSFPVQNLWLPQDLSIVAIAGQCCPHSQGPVLQRCCARQGEAQITSHPGWVPRPVPDPTLSFGSW
jgi:hypothetical protein